MLHTIQKTSPSISSSSLQPQPQSPHSLTQLSSTKHPTPRCGVLDLIQNPIALDSEQASLGISTDLIKDALNSKNSLDLCSKIETALIQGLSYRTMKDIAKSLIRNPFQLGDFLELTYDINVAAPRSSRPTSSSEEAIILKTQRYLNKYKRRFNIITRTILEHTLEIEPRDVKMYLYITCEYAERTNAVEQGQAPKIYALGSEGKYRLVKSRFTNYGFDQLLHLQNGYKKHNKLLHRHSQAAKEFDTQWSKFETALLKHPHISVTSLSTT